MMEAWGVAMSRRARTHARVCCYSRVILPCLASSSSTDSDGFFSSGMQGGGSSFGTTPSPPIKASSTCSSTSCGRQPRGGDLLVREHTDKRGTDLVLVRVVVQADAVLLQGQQLVFLHLDGETDGSERRWEGGEKREEAA